MALNAGSFNQRVQIQTNRPGKEADGQSIQHWSPSFDRSASVNAVSATKDQQTYEQMPADVTHLVIMRRDTKTRNLTTANRLLWRDRVLNIYRAMEVDLGTDEERMELQCIWRQEGV